MSELELIQNLTNIVEGLQQSIKSLTESMYLIKERIEKLEGK